jgi:hypothetical protein
MHNSRGWSGRNRFFIPVLAVLIISFICSTKSESGDENGETAKKSGKDSPDKVTLPEEKLISFEMAGSYVGASGSVNKFHIWKNTMYATCGKGLQIFDVKDSAKPVSLSTVEIPLSKEEWPERAGPAFHDLQGFTIMNSCVVGFDERGTVWVINTTNLKKPFIAGELDLGNKKSMSFLTGGMKTGSYRNYAFFLIGDGIIVIDVKNQAKPKLAGKIKDVAYGDDFSIHGGLLYCHKKETWVRIYDISNPEKIKLLSTPSSEKPTGYAVDGTCFVLSLHGKGIFLYDVSKPGEPRLTGSCMKDGWSFSGLKFAGNRLYAFSGTGGSSSTLQIVDVSDKEKPSFLGSVFFDRCPEEMMLFNNCVIITTSAKRTVVINASDPENPVIEEIWKPVHNSDFIVLADDRLFIGNYSNEFRVYLFPEKYRPAKK